MQRINSRHNPIVARYRAAARRDSADLVLLDGIHLVREALDAGVRLRHAAVRPTASSSDELDTLVARLERAGVDIVAASDKVMEVLSPVRSSSAIVALAERPQPSIETIYGGGRALVVIVSGIQDPGNVGAIVRVAEAGGASGVVVSGGSADPFGWKALRGSMGSSLRLPVVTGGETESAVADAQRHGCRLIATTPRGGRQLTEVNLRPPTAVLIGGEGGGLEAAFVDAADECVTIPMQPPVESLNAAVTAALLVYEARRQRMNQD
jgi:TrmH family RNA methyltransferase